MPKKKKTGIEILVNDQHKLIAGQPHHDWRFDGLNLWRCLKCHKRSTIPKVEVCYGKGG